MAGDFSRSSLNPIKHYTGVLMQQGRVQVDADWNEQLALQLHRTQTETIDLIGKCGTPKGEDGFLISQLAGVQDLRIHPGRYYVNGLLCELDPEWIPIAARSGALVNLPSLNIDGWDLAVNDWVELEDEGGNSLVAKVILIGASTAASDSSAIVPNFFTVTLSKAIGILANAKHLKLRRATTFTTQPFFVDQWDAAMESSPLSGPSGETLNLPDGDYLVVLDAWLTEVNALADPHIREIALGGPDTCERLQTAWQVHLIPYGGEKSPPSSPLASPPNSSPLDCCSDFPGWNEFQAAAKTTGLMNAQAPPPGNEQCPCLLPPSAGYLGLENQLYRVEIFQSGDYNKAATFVWSRDNAMVETTILCIDPQGNVYVSSLGKDDLHSFGQGDWVEIVSPQSAMSVQPRFLAQITQTPSQQNAPCLSTNPPAYSISLSAQLPTQLLNGTSLRLRRWDMPQTLPTGQTMLMHGTTPLGIQIQPGWTLLENNVQVNFSDGHYASGDYWQIPARTATGDIEWPPFDIPNVNPIPQPPLGSPHSYCRLAILTVTNGVWNTPVDCRCQFPSLEDICATDVCYKGSDCGLQTATTVAQAIDALAGRIRYHNKMLHGTGVVCGLAVSCAGDTRVGVAKGYAIDCEGYDLIVDQAATLDMTKIGVNSEGGKLADGDYELVLERAKLDTSAAGIDQAREQEDVVVVVDPVPVKDTACCGKSVKTQQPNACVSFRVVPCQEPTFVQQMLDGTLVKDFYDHCIQTLIDKFKSKYGGQFIGTDKQVSESQALLSSLTNLLIQYLQPSLTQDVYISLAEYKILAEFYRWLRDQLSDKTFCALLSGAREFPEYTLGSAAKMTTVFGKGYKTRLRVDPAGALGYAVGAGPNIQLFDLASGQLATVVTLPIPGDPSAWVVQDVAFSADGKQVYAIATGTNTTTSKADSLFAAGTVASFNVTWTTSGSLGGLGFLTLATATNPAGAAGPTLFASVRAQGIFSITFGSSAPTTASVATFAAIGQLISNGQYLFATANSGKVAAGTFDQVVVYRTTSWTTPSTFQMTGFTGDLTDDIALYSFAMQQPYTETLLAVSASASSGGSKELLLFPYSSGPALQQQVVNGAASQQGAYPLGENTTVRMAANTTLNALMVTLEASSRMLEVTYPNGAASINAYAPMELHPTSIAFAAPPNGASTMYALNSTANTIGVIPGNMAAFTADKTLEAWRVSAMNAFIDLGAAVLQNLKDCFCDLLLPPCPSCDEQSPEGLGVGLACITVKNGKVYKVCNLEARQYVKTFKTWGYWLSLIPIIPALKALVSRFCCAILPELASKASAPQNDGNIPYKGFATMNGETLRYAAVKVGSAQTYDVRSAFVQQATPVSKMALDSLTTQFKPSVAATGLKLNQVNGLSLDQAKTNLSGAQVNIAATQAYDPTAFAKNAAAYSTMPATVPAGSSVTLVVDSNNQVRYVVPTPPVLDELSATVQTNQADVLKQVTAVAATGTALQARLTADEAAVAPTQQSVQSLQNLVTTLQTNLTTLQTSQAAALAQRDAQIATLTTQTQDLQTKLASFADLATTVKELQARLPAPPAPPVKG